MRSPERSIPLYSLYGENDVIEDTEFVHVEDVESRSKLYDWEIEPHTHANLLQILLIAEGTIDVTVDNQSQQMAAPCIITTPPGVVHGFRFSKDTNGSVISVSTDFLRANPGQPDAQIITDILTHPAAVSFADSPGRFKTAREITRAIQTEYSWPQPGRAMMFDALLRILLLQVRRKMSLPHERNPQKGYRRITFVQFKNMVDKKFRDKWTVPDYAAQMGITESRLNRICQSFTGKTAFEVIQDRVLMEAQRYLIYTSAPIAEICYDLGFNDPGYFSRFFKKNLGVTPKAFRQDKSSNVTP